MAQVLDAELRRALADRVRYYQELGIYDFYRREPQGAVQPQTLGLKLLNLHCPLHPSQNCERK